MNIPFHALSREAAVAHSSAADSTRPCGTALAAAAAGSEADSDFIHGAAKLALMMTKQ